MLVQCSTIASASGCGSEVKYPAVTGAMVGGRHFLDVVPADYDASSEGRLIIQYHGYGMSKEWMRELAGDLGGYRSSSTAFLNLKTPTGHKAGRGFPLLSKQDTGQIHQLLLLTTGPD